jgi:hypothetical protein
MAKEWTLDEPITPAELTRMERDIERALENSGPDSQPNRDAEILIWMGAV